MITDDLDLLDELTDTTNLLDLLLGQLAEISSSDDNWLLWKDTLTKDLEDASLLAINNWDLGGLSVSDSGLFWDEAPYLIDVDGWAVISISSEMEMSHSDLTEVTWMVLVKIDSVMVLTTGLTATTWMLAVLSDTSVTHADVTSKGSGLLQS